METKFGVCKIAHQDCIYLNQNTVKTIIFLKRTTKCSWLGAQETFLLLSQLEIDVLQIVLCLWKTMTTMIFLMKNI